MRPGAPASGPAETWGRPSGGTKVALARPGGLITVPSLTTPGGAAAEGRGSSGRASNSVREGGRFAVVRRRRGRQSLLQFLERQLQGFARDLARVAARFHQGEEVLPGLV